MKSVSRRSHLQVRILLRLEQGPARTVTELAVAVGARRPSVRRSLKTLRNDELVARRWNGWTLTLTGEEEAKRCNQELTGAADSLNRTIKGIAAVELMQATKPISESLVSGVLAKTMGGTSLAPLAERQLAISGAIAQSFAPLAERQLAISGAIAQSFAPLAERQLAISGAIAQSFAPLAERQLAISGAIAQSFAPSREATRNIWGIAQSFAPLAERQLAISGAIAQSFAPLVERQLAISGAIAQSFAPLASGAIAQSFAPLAERHRLLSGVITRSPGLTSFSRAVAGIVRSAELTSLLSRKFSETLAPFREKDQFEEAEWFPHSTFPRHLLNWNGHEAYSDEIVLTYYRENWTTVSQVIEKELSECHVDMDVKEAVRQALIAHENGLYQLVPPSLFTAIERAVRVCLYDDKVGHISVRDRLVNLAGKLPISILPDGLLGFVGFTQLSHHLYENIHTDNVRERFLGASIPNRHAAIHGLVIYSTEKHSLNTIFVAMYVFRILTVLKLRYLRSS